MSLQDLYPLRQPVAVRPVWQLAPKTSGEGQHLQSPPDRALRTETGLSLGPPEGAGLNGHPGGPRSDLGARKRGLHKHQRCEGSHLRSRDACANVAPFRPAPLSSAAPAPARDVGDWCPTLSPLLWVGMWQWLQPTDPVWNTCSQQSRVLVFPQWLPAGVLRKTGN